MNALTTCVSSQAVELADIQHGPDFASPQPAALPIWLGIACVMAVGIDLRPGVASIGPLVPELSREFGMSSTQAAVLTTLPPLLMGLLALPSPWLAHRFGRNRVIIAAILLVTAATAMRALSESPAMLFVTTAGVGAGIAVAGALIGGFVKTNFPHRAALFMGLYAMSLGLGATLAAGLTGPLVIFAQDWRMSAGIWAVPGLIAIAAWMVIALRERGQGATASLSPPRSRLPVRSLAAWRIALYFAANNILFFGLLAWLVPLYLDRGRDPVMAGLILTSFTVAFMIGNPIPGLVGGKGDRRIQIGLAALASLAGLLGISLGVESLSFVFVPLVALGIGSSFTLGMTLPLDHAKDPHEANTLNAFVLAFGYGFGASGPLLVGLLYDLSGGFQLPLLFLGSAGMAMLMLTPFLGRPRGIVDQATAPQIGSHQLDDASSGGLTAVGGVMATTG